MKPKETLKASNLYSGSGMEKRVEMSEGDEILPGYNPKQAIGCY
jgi:hypothetical protein